MEFEIEDGEVLLFDKSTNPSLLHERRGATCKRSPNPRWAYPHDARNGRKAVVIPEEEEQLS